MNPAHTDRLGSIAIVPESPDCDSLVAALRAILAAYGRLVDYDELAAVTGIAFMTTCALQAPLRTRWNVYGRHSFLVPAAREYGLDLRELHPPDAAPVPRTPPEFEGHFRDSYLPFVEAALARDEPVLAWMGWPPPNDYEWGVITSTDPATRRCIGQTLHFAGNEVLAASPVQVYVVQGYRDVDVSIADRVASALDRAATVLQNRIDPAYGIITGPPATNQLQSDFEAIKRSSEEDARVWLHDILRSTESARGAAARFLEFSRPNATSAESTIIECLSASLGYLMALLWYSRARDTSDLFVRWTNLETQAGAFLKRSLGH